MLQRLAEDMPTSLNPPYRRHRFPPEVISYAVWLYFRFPLSLRRAEELLAARGICVTYETVRLWGRSSARHSPKGRSAKSADRLDPVGLTVIVDEGDHSLNRRSSSAAAK
jgi:transposase-like protein